MSQSSLENFSDNFIRFMNVPKENINNSRDAFYAGAHTCFILMQKAIENKDFNTIASLANELEVYRALKELTNSETH